MRNSKTFREFSAFYVLSFSLWIVLRCAPLTTTEGAVRLGFSVLPVIPRLSEVVEYDAPTVVL